MNVLMTVDLIAPFTGVGQYVYTLAQALIERGHHVALAAHYGAIPIPFADRLAAVGVTVDPQWLLWKAHYDVLHVQLPCAHAAEALGRLPGVPVVATLHTELAGVPLPHRRVARYLAVRPAIAHLLLDHGVIDPLVVWNPIDFRRFHPGSHHGTGILCVGTADRLRRAAVVDMAERAAAEGEPLVVIGADEGAQVPGVRYLAPRWHVERATVRCAMTAGVMVGRSTLEGWACGKPALVYDVDCDGAVQSVTLQPPPADLSFCDSRVVAAAVEGCYQDAA